MVGDTLRCPRCFALLRRAPGLAPGAAVVCPRCQTHFTAPADTTHPGQITAPEPRSVVREVPLRSPDSGLPWPAGKLDADEDHPPRYRRSRSALTIHLRVACVIEALAVLVALVAAFVEIRSVPISGVLLSLVGIYVAVVGLCNSFRLGTAAGLSAPGISFLLFAVICGFEWGPTKAETPVRLVGLAYAAVLVPLLSSVALFPWFFRSASERERDRLEP